MDLMYCRSREEELKKVTKVAEILSGKDNNKLPWSFKLRLFHITSTIVRALATNLSP